jgi:hypothetical protein
MKKDNYCNILYIALLGLVCGCAKYPAYEITNPPFVNKTSLNMYIGDNEQLIASSIDEDFKWSSDNEDVASVNRTGLVTAVGEGLASIIVSSYNAETKVDVRVKEFIILTDINLPKTSLKLYVGDKAQIWAYPIPNDASEVTFSWHSENSDIATVNKNGMITAASRGITNIIVSSGSIEKKITVSIPEVYMCEKTEWSIVVSDETASDGGGKNKIIDNDRGTGGYWHSKWSGGNAPLPHWAIIDMKEQVEIARIVTQRRNNGDTKSLQYFVGDDPNPNADTWTKIAEGMYLSKEANHILSLNVTESVPGRYLKLLMPDSFRSPFTAICEIDVFKLVY